jgi:acyl-CoA dehydrogenase
VDHARTRRQSGRPIGAFQAVSQRLADAYAEVESARSRSGPLRGSRANNRIDPGLPRVRRTFAADAAVRTCERALQVLGGTGFTREHPLHRFYRRAGSIRSFMGRPTELRERVAASLLDPSGTFERDD